MEDVRANLNPFQRVVLDRDDDDVRSDVLLRGSSREINARLAIDSFDSSEIEIEYLPGHRFTAIFHGAILIPFGGLLRLAQKTGALERYRNACRNAAERAVFAAERRMDGQRVELPQRLSASIYLSGGQPFENDELAASCKFLIEGFRIAGLLNQEDPTQIVSFDSFLQRCGNGESLSVGMTFRLAYKS